METARSKDTGTLEYDVFLSDDQSEGVVHERYRDSDALLQHSANLGELMAARNLSTTMRQRWVEFSEPPRRRSTRAWVD
jgi:quinol monooxygenase YgiN